MADHLAKVAPWSTLYEDIVLAKSLEATQQYVHGGQKPSKSGLDKKLGGTISTPSSLHADETLVSALKESLRSCTYAAHAMRDSEVKLSMMQDGTAKLTAKAVLLSAGKAIVKLTRASAILQDAVRGSQGAHVKVEDGLIRTLKHQRREMDSGKIAACLLIAQVRLKHLRQQAEVERTEVAARQAEAQEALETERAESCACVKRLQSQLDSARQEMAALTQQLEEQAGHAQEIDRLREENAYIKAQFEKARDKLLGSIGV